MQELRAHTCHNPGLYHPIQLVICIAGTWGVFSEEKDSGGDVPALQHYAIHGVQLEKGI